MKSSLVIVVLLILSQPAFALKQLHVKAEYFPVNAKIKEQVAYPIKDYTISIESEDRVSVSFDLPIDLVGTKNRAVFRLAETTNSARGVVRRLEGNKGTLTCFGKWSEARCTVAFKNLEVDYNRLHRLDRTDKRDLVRLAKDFSEEPLGIVMVSSK